jgi:uncharacterized protein YciI
MPEYIYLLHPFRDGFFENPMAEEISTMEEHSQYLNNAVEAGIVILAGSCLDATFGIVIIFAKDDATARNFMLNDPAVSKNVMMAELHPMRISFKPE